MPVLLYRVDERLIHGQVTVGWGGRLNPSLYLVVDEELPSLDLERDLYSLGLPRGSEARFHTVAEARDLLDDWRESPTRALLLTRDLDQMVRLAKGNRLRGETVNIGGIYHRSGRSKVLPYVYLDEADRHRIQVLEEEGVEVVAQDVPGAHKTYAAALLGE